MSVLSDKTTFPVQRTADRIEFERSFSLAKRCYWLGLIRTKLDSMTRSSICLSIIAMNVDRIVVVFLQFFEVVFLILSGYISRCIRYQKSAINHCCVKLPC